MLTKKEKQIINYKMNIRSIYGHPLFQHVGLHMSQATNGVFTPEQDKTKTRQMLNLLIPMMAFTSGPTCLV